MSHVASIKLEIKDLGSLKKACERLGLEFVEDKKNYKWYGTAVSSNSAPPGFTNSELGKCEHAIRVKDKPNAYEIGVVTARNGLKGYQLLLDEWNGGYGLVDKIGSGAGLLKQAYSLEVAKKQALREGFRVTEVTKANGDIVLEAQQ